MLLADESFIDRLVASGTKDQMMTLLAKDPMAEN
jgi:PTS system fructose-specific IIA component